LRDAFTLYCPSGLSVKEIAVTLGLTQAAAKTRVFRARAKVRVHLLPVWSHRHVA
jgi:DNA-directed RNA polymerase specialized sigma24 family protein